jgi:hypothetical protein
MTKRFILAAICGFSLTACASNLPSFEFRSGAAPEQLRIESEPTGAEARSSQGPTCQTPCEFAIPSGSDFLVTVAMNGYQPVTVPVRPESPGGKLQPNPVYVELQAVAPAVPATKGSARKKAPQGAKIQQ